MAALSEVGVAAKYISLCIYGTRSRCTYVRWLVSIPNISMRHEGQKEICAAPLLLLNQAVYLQYRHGIHHLTELLVEYEGLEVLHNGLPVAVMRVRKATKRNAIRQEAVVSGDPIVFQARDSSEDAVSVDTPCARRHYGGRAKVYIQ